MRRRNVLVLAMLAAGCNALTGASDLTVGNGGKAGHGTATHASGGTSASTTSTTSTTGTGGTAGSAPTDGGLEASDSCAAVTCSGHGTCAADAGAAMCGCDPGYHAVGLGCDVDETCAGKACGACGMCEVVGGIATCTCPADYAWSGTDCKLTFDPCVNAGCGPDQACVPEAHCQALGACVDTCDCSNCPNCGPDNSDGRWNDWQEYCGAAPNASPATMACTRPCTGGAGCLPYSPQICWPLEGCFSL